MIPRVLTAKLTSRRVVALAQGFGSLLLIGWLVQHVSWQASLRALAQASPGLIALGCAVYYLGIVLSCYKWYVILRIEQIRIPLEHLVRWYLIGSLANHFLPSDVGGDVGRGFYASRFAGNPIAIARSILVERATGLGMMLVLAWIGLIVVVGAATLALLLLSGLLLSSIAAWVLLRAARHRLPERLQPLARRCSAVAALYLRQPRAVALVLVLSLLFQMLAGFGAWLNLRAVHAGLPLLIVLLAAAITNALGVLPIAINGWGVKEAVFVGLLRPYHAPASDLLAGMLLARALVLVASLVGIVPLVLERTRGGWLRRSPTQ
jgi:uncharacterized membrane protein YbhN (UPF0104 family)